MPLTIDPNPTKLDVADREELALDLTGDASYPTGGYDLSALDLPLRCKVRVDSVEGRDTTGAYYLVHDEANDKVLVHQVSDGAEVAGTTDLSAIVFKARILGR